MALTVGSLFAGIGGFDLGFERAGFAIKWQVEIDPFCRAVLAKHWPNVRRYEDVRTVFGYRPDVHGYFGGHFRGPRLEGVDVMCGGFPCQDISVAGDGAGIDGERSGLWREFARLIGELRPRYVVVENVPGLLSRGLGRVLGDLAESGYDAEWDCLPASAAGAPHQRDRVWLVAYPDDQRELQPQGQQSDQRRRTRDGGQAVAEASGNGLERPVSAGDGERQAARIFTRRALAGGSLTAGAEQWRTEPDVGRVAHGIPARVDRLRGLGNAIVPQIAQWIAECIKQAEAGEAERQQESR